jgi:hypothetical protein
MPPTPCPSYRFRCVWGKTKVDPPGAGSENYNHKDKQRFTKSFQRSLCAIVPASREGVRSALPLRVQVASEMARSR